MNRLLILLLLVCILAISCKTKTDHPKLRFLGNAEFRRSYSGHEHWSDAKFDSAQKENPLLMGNQNDSTLIVFDILKKLGLVNQNELLLYKITPSIKDTIILVSQHKSNDTVYTSFEPFKQKAFIYVKGKNIIDSSSIAWNLDEHGLSIVKVDSIQVPFILYLDHYYIMNGDNYGVSMYQVY